MDFSHIQLQRTMSKAPAKKRTINKPLRADEPDDKQKLREYEFTRSDSYRRAVESHISLLGKDDTSYFTLSEAIRLWGETESDDGRVATVPPFYLGGELPFEHDPPRFPAIENPKFKFIDLFAGVGGFRMALQQLGGECVFSSEWDSAAQETYYRNYGEYPFGDITLESTKKHVPRSFDVLCAGFPCQAFSIAGKRGGFEDTRGTLFFDVAEIIRSRQPKAVFLENVKGLRNHDGGKTLATILNVLREDLGYFVPDPEIVNARDFGVPQNRERIYIVAFHPSTGVSKFSYPRPLPKRKVFADVKEKDTVDAKYYLSTQYLKTLEEHRRRHESKGNGFGYEVIPDDGIANAIVVGGMGRERNLVLDDRLTDFTPTTRIKGEVNRKGIRRMTPREWARLQGFPDRFLIAKSDAQAYKQFGNSVAVPAIKATARQILSALNIE
ncbi:DNA cytosine methyltransferase [Aquilutibacter rugosus]|uniref:DNA cytosine methyltransferase n=1 Tax=Aquilutibacter rugosus TaxID=3115820 RepID=UPI002F410C4C